MSSASAAAATSEDLKEETNPQLIAWECFGLSAEEYIHTIQLYLKNKNGKPLGHR
jgi:hypothetical protein